MSVPGPFIVLLVGPVVLPALRIGLLSWRDREARIAVALAGPARLAGHLERGRRRVAAGRDGARGDDAGGDAPQPGGGLRPGRVDADGDRP
jgi:hypothetical protein